MKEEALAIAERLEILCTNPNNGEITFDVKPVADVAVLLRKLVEEIDNLTLLATHYEFLSRHLGMIVREKEEANERTRT